MKICIFDSYKSVKKIIQEKWTNNMKLDSAGKKEETQSH